MKSLTNALDLGTQGAWKTGKEQTQWFQFFIRCVFSGGLSAHKNTAEISVSPPSPDIDDDLILRVVQGVELV